MSAERATFVLYPRGARSGGPELLHQLVDEMRRQGRTAYLVPIPGTESAEPVSEYRHYTAPEASWPDDDAGSRVVAPESYLRLLRSFRSAERVCWWQSIDNCPGFAHERLRAARRAGVPEARRVESARFLLRKSVHYSWPRWPRELFGMRHLTQSAYAWSYLYCTVGVVPRMVGDYVATTPLDAPQADPAASRVATGGDAVIAYNPRKGGELIARLRATWRGPESWVPVTGLTAAGVAELLARASVYVDLGHQPGKDRLPREAARRGAVVVIAARGAGGFYEDFPLSERYKATAGRHIVEDAAGKLSWALHHLEQARTEQRPYRDLLATERETFRAQVASAFVP